VNRRARAGRELVVPERFHEEVVGAVFDFRQRGGQRGIRGDYDDRDVAVQRVMPQRPADLQARDVRGAEVHEHQVEGLGRRLLQCRHAVGNRLARVAIEPEPGGHGVAKPGFVLDQQNARARGRKG
jgi:hypothetical protein